MIKTVLATAAVAVMLSGLAGCEHMPWQHPVTPLGYPSSLPAFPMNGLLSLPTGVTLYSFDKDADAKGGSACNDDCAKVWPPFLAPDGAPDKLATSGNFSVITRADGSHQWAYKGAPLYTYSKDTRAGDTTGDNRNQVWHVVKP